MLSTSEPHARTLSDFVGVEPEIDFSATPITAPKRSARSPRLILYIVAGFSLIGIAFALWLRTVPAGHADPRLAFNVFYFLFAHHEAAGLLLVALFSAGTAVFLFRGGRQRFADLKDVDLPRWVCPVVALLTFAIAAIGTQAVFHNYSLTADEYLADFQAKIFLRGKIQAEVPMEWIDAVRVIKPTFIDYFPANHSWNQTYLPVYAAMRAVFQSVSLQSLLNPFLAAITVFALYGAARNIWPESKMNALVAIGLLASSSQFLIMSMTTYAMPAHLALNGVWLWLYSRPDRRRFYLAPFVGVLAIGLHQPIGHALFVLPFLARLVFQKRWRAVAVFGAIYLAGCVGWYLWRTQFPPPPMKAGTGISSIFRLFNPSMAVIQPMNLLLVIGWASLATPMLALLGVGRFRKARPIVQDAILSCVLTFGFYYFFYLDQAHGWGYRYFHGALACLIIVAVAGFSRLSLLTGERAARKFVLAGIVLSILLQLPLRCVQAENFVRPYARTAALIHSMPYDIVALDCRDAWYSADLIRNDPFLEQRPIIVSLFGLNPAAINLLEQKGRARFITRDELTRLGMPTERRDDYRRDPFLLGRGK